MDEQPCNCPDPKLCQRLKKHICGRLWEIWNGVNIDAGTAQTYRNLWMRRAGLQKEMPKAAAPSTGGCGCKKKG